MKRPAIKISAGAFLIFSALYFFDDELFLPALLPAVAAHEAGHALFLRMGGARVRALHLDTGGLRMDYSGALSARAETAAIFAGPVFGLLYTAGLSRLGKALGSDFLLLSAGLSLFLSLFNLLPCRPLDGGRALGLLLGDSAALCVFELASALALLACGLWLGYRGHGFALCAGGMWLLLFWGGVGKARDR